MISKNLRFSKQLYCLFLRRSLLPCRKGEGTGMRVTTARHDEVRQQKTYTGSHTGRNGESKQFVKKSERKLRKRYLTPFGFSDPFDFFHAHQRGLTPLMSPDPFDVSLMSPGPLLAIFANSVKKTSLLVPLDPYSSSSRSLPNCAALIQYSSFS